MKKLQIENSEKSEMSENSEKLFHVFLFPGLKKAYTKTLFLHLTYFLSIKCIWKYTKIVSCLMSVH